MVAAQSFLSKFSVLVSSVLRQCINRQDSTFLGMLAELQIVGDIEDNFEDHFSYISTKPYVVTPH